MEKPRYRDSYNVYVGTILHHIRCQSVEIQNHGNRYRNFAKSLGKKTSRYVLHYKTEEIILAHGADFNQWPCAYT